MVIVCADDTADFDRPHADPQFAKLRPYDCDNEYVEDGATIPDPVIELCCYVDHAHAQVRLRSPQRLWPW